MQSSVTSFYLYLEIHHLIFVSIDIVMLIVMFYSLETKRASSLLCKLFCYRGEGGYSDRFEQVSNIFTAMIVNVHILYTVGMLMFLAIFCMNKVSESGAPVVRYESKFGAPNVGAIRILWG